MTSGVGNGSAKVYMPARRFAVCRSGTVAMRSVARASASAAAKPFAYASGTSDIASAQAPDIASGTRWTFAVAATLIAVALAVVIVRRPARTSLLRKVIVRGHGVRFCFHGDGRPPIIAAAHAATPTIEEQAR